MGFIGPSPAPLTNYIHTVPVRGIGLSDRLIAQEPKFEKWGNFPKERQRLLNLIEKTNAQNVFLLSGDRHIASISKVDLPKYGPLYEITSSSLINLTNIQMEIQAT